MLGRLRCAAAGNQDGELLPKRFIRPKQMIIRPAPLPVLPEQSIVIETIDRTGIRIAFVEVPDFPGRAQ